jgi:hypothetical protein
MTDKIHSKKIIYLKKTAQIKDENTFEIIE